METANDTTMHVTETKTLCSSLTCPPSKSEEITKDQEEELLCGNSEDGDEEDALSDDSMRLRLSDDEAELDEPSASENVTDKKPALEGMNMELGSDVPATETSEQKNALWIQKLSNGECALESNDSRINQEDRGPDEDFAEDVVPDTEFFNDISAKPNPCNGDSAQTERRSTGEAPIAQMQEMNKWKFSGHFGEYTNRGNRVAQSRKPYSESNRYATDPYADKYYNKNTYYGGGKGSNRGYSSYFRESLNRDGTSVDKYSSRVPSPNTTRKESEVTQTTRVSPQPIKFEPRTPEPLDSENAVTNNGEFESCEPSQTHESVNSSEDTNGLLKNDNDKVEAASTSTNNLAPEEIPENEAPSHENPAVDPVADPVADLANDPAVDCELSAGTVKSEAVELNDGNSSAETLVAEDLNNSVGETFSGSKDVSGEAEPQPTIPEDANGDADEVNNEATEEIDANVVSEKTDEIANEVPSSENSEAQDSAEKTQVPTEIVETEGNSQVGSDCRSSLERAEVELAAEIEKSDDPKEIDEKTNEVDEPKRSESPKAKSPVEETENPAQVETDVVSTATDEKQRNVEEPERAMEEPSIVATNDGEMVQSAVASAVDKEVVASQAKILDIEDHIADLPDEKETSSEDEGEVKNVRMHTSLKRTSTESLDEMELSRRMRIKRKHNEPNEPNCKDVAAEVVPTEETAVIDGTQDNASTVANPVTNSTADSKSSSESEASLISNTVVESPTSQLPGELESAKPESANGNGKVEKVDDCEIIEVPVKKRQKRSRRSMQIVRETVGSQEDNQEKENVRQKRRTAKNAEEIIRKEFLGHSDSESNDSAGNFVAVNYNKSSNTLRAASPPTLKRNFVEEDENIEPASIKKLKQDLGTNGNVSMKNETPNEDKIQTLQHVRKFFRRDGNGKLAKLKQEELEELLIQKVVETITMRDEIGRLREQAKISERNQEATRLRCQQLAKQIKDFEMVLNRYQSDRRSNPDKTVVPIKINRSVGLQVNFVTDHGIQNLRQLGQVQKAVATTPTVNGTSSPQQSEPSPGPVALPKRTVKVRSPRRPEPPVASPTVTTPVITPVHNPPIITNITPAALVVTKNVTESRTQVTPTVQHTNVPHLLTPKQTLVVNGPVTNQPIRQATAIQVSKANNSDLIDLTQEEDKTKNAVVPQNTILTTAITEATPTISNVQKIAPRYHTVIQTLPGNMAITAQPGIRVVQPSSQPTPTALVNNMNAPRLAYVMQGGMGSTRQVVVTSAPAPIRPAPAIRTSYPLSGTITNGTVRVIPMTSAATIQVYRHPAALPESLNPPSNPAWKLPPPAPSLKISKVSNGIVLSWNMTLSDKHADIASYQLYAYQEVSGIAPNTTLWKKVGDVRALPLPMACTLTQFSEGNNYYFAVRAVDKHSRLGLYSQPGNISL